MRNACFMVAFALIAGLAGCAKLDRTAVRLENLSGCPSQTVVGLAKQQDQLGPHSTPQKLECALAFLRGTGNPSLLRSPLGSRIALHLAERKSDPEQRKSLAAEGVRFAEKALALGADGDGAVHYYLAANLGLEVRDDATRAAESLPRLEAEIKRAVELSASLDDGGPLRLLGMLYLKAPPWPIGIGDGDKALYLLQQAAERFPRHPLNHLFYAQALWESEEDHAEDRARAELVIGKKRLADGDWGYSIGAWQQEFAQFEKEIHASGA